MRTPPCPPEPWHLRGGMYVSLWHPRAGEVPHRPLPAGVRPLVVAGRCVLPAFWADYRPGGTLTYHELLVALVVRDGRGIAATAVAVLVDDQRSLVGGRELWGIPKRPGAFAFVSPPRDGPTGPQSAAGGPRPTGRDPCTGASRAGASQCAPSPRNRVSTTMSAACAGLRCGICRDTRCMS